MKYLLIILIRQFDILEEIIRFFWVFLILGLMINQNMHNSLMVRNARVGFCLSGSIRMTCNNLYVSIVVSNAL